jgi:predicted transcriptional regulator
MLPVARKNRGTMEIVAFMLESAVRECKKTHIMYRSNLSYTLLKKYLNMVLSNGLMIYDPVTETYRTSQKGITYLREYAEIKRSMKVYSEKKVACEILLK